MCRKGKSAVWIAQDFWRLLQHIPETPPHKHSNMSAMGNWDREGNTDGLHGWDSEHILCLEIGLHHNRRLQVMVPVCHGGHRDTPIPGYHSTGEWDLSWQICPPQPSPSDSLIGCESRQTYHWSLFLRSQQWQVWRCLSNFYLLAVLSGCWQRLRWGKSW